LRISFSRRRSSGSEANKVKPGVSDRSDPIIFFLIYVTGKGCGRRSEYFEVFLIPQGLLPLAAKLTAHHCLHREFHANPVVVVPATRRIQAQFCTSVRRVVPPADGNNCLPQ